MKKTLKQELEGYWLENLHIRIKYNELDVKYKATEKELEELKRDVQDFTKLLQIYFDKYGGEIKSPLFDKLSKVGEKKCSYFQL